MNKKNITITFDPSRDEIVGVYKGKIYTKCNCFKADKDIPAILIMNKPTFIKTWRNWIKGKETYCERFNHFCGVMGYTTPKDFFILDTKMDIPIWNKSREDYDIVSHILIDIKSFEDLHDFEHG